MSLNSYDAHAILKSAQSKGIDPSLEPVKEMLKELGDPDLSYACIQVVGTNGKTSTARYTAAILAGEGKHVGLFLSPCLVSYEDQIEIDGRAIDRQTLDSMVGAAFEAGERVNRRRMENGLAPLPNTEFDLLTVAALYAFSLAKVDVAVLEAGLGARWDATSAARSIGASCITGFGLDHTKILGNSLEDIARNKSYAIVSGRKCILGPGAIQDPAAHAVIFARCRDQGVLPAVVLEGEGNRTCEAANEVRYKIEQRPRGIDGFLELSVKDKEAEYKGIRVQKPSYQAQNIACSIALAQETLGHALNNEQLAASVYNCRTPGRFELLRNNPPILVDACHNPQSVQAFVSAIREAIPQKDKRPTLLCAIFADKDVVTMVGMLANEFNRIVVTQTDSPRAMDAGELALLFEHAGVAPVAITQSVDEALQFVENMPFVACGSITTAGEVARAITKGAATTEGEDR